MARTTPTLGHPSRSAAARALKAEGYRNCEIARRMGVSQNAVSGLLASRSPQQPERAGPAAHRPAESPARRVLEVRLSDDEFVRLIAAARSDKQTPTATARMFIQCGLALRGV